MPNQKEPATSERQFLTVFLCGDVMTGRGIDQILPHPGSATLHESYVKNAFDYVTLAERRNGDIPRPADPAYIWGDALKVWSEIAPDLRIANLETSITSSSDFWAGKGIHYRMAPRNISCLNTAKFDCCVLANNHVLDWGYSGLNETVTTLQKAGISIAGTGQNVSEAIMPARIRIAAKSDVLVFGYADTSSGVPRAWRADRETAGVNLLENLSLSSARRIAEQILEIRRAGDIVVASIHWGGNWGYEIPDEQRKFAHYLIDEGAADIVHGHSSHHPKAIEIYRHKPVIYGCGDFLTDYEGIGGYEAFRPWFSLMYFVTLDLRSGNIRNLQIVPLCVRRMSLVHAGAENCRWLVNKLNALSKGFSTRFELTNDRLVLAEMTAH